MLSQPTNTYAQSLALAASSGEKIPSIRQHEAEMEMVDAYAVQSARNALVIEGGAHQIGWKIGFSAKPVMAMLGVSAPVAGMMTNDRVFAAGTIPAGRLVAPRFEAEIAFVMKADLEGPNCTVADVAAATAYVSPAIELVDGRILPKDPATGAGPTALDMVADNVAFGGLIMGEAQHAVDAFDLRRVGVSATLNGEVEETGLGASVYGDPLAAVAWLANYLSERGSKISAGQTILSGSLVRHFACPAGSTACADFDVFGQVEVNFP